MNFQQHNVWDLSFFESDCNRDWRPFDVPTDQALFALAERGGRPRKLRQSIARWSPLQEIGIDCFAPTIPEGAAQSYALRTAAASKQNKILLVHSSLDDKTLSWIRTRYRYQR